MLVAMEIKTTITMTFAWQFFTLCLLSLGTGGAPTISRTISRQDNGASTQIVTTENIIRTSPLAPSRLLKWSSAGQEPETDFTMVLTHKQRRKITAVSAQSSMGSKGPQMRQSSGDFTKTRPKRNTWLPSSSPSKRPQHAGQALASSTDMKEATSVLPPSPTGMREGTAQGTRTQEPPQAPSLPPLSPHATELTTKAATTRDASVMSPPPTESDRTSQPPRATPKGSTAKAPTSIMTRDIQTTNSITPFIDKTSMAPTGLSSTTSVVTTTTTTAFSSTFTGFHKALVPDESPASKQSGSRPGIAVAVIIGGVLILMIVVIVGILVRKRLLQQKKKESAAWAGPTPFLDGDFQPNLHVGEDDGVGRAQPYKRVSVHNFLLGRSSKHQSLLKDGDDVVAMEDLQEGSTFGRTQEACMPTDNGSTPDNKSQSAPNKPSPAAEITAPGLPAPDNVNPEQGPADKESTMPPPPPLDSPSIPPAPLLDIDLGPPAEENIPSLPPSDGPVVPPPPPLPSSTK